jgi:hypothetical protein
MTSFGVLDLMLLKAQDRGFFDGFLASSRLDERSWGESSVATANPKSKSRILTYMRTSDQLKTLLLGAALVCVPALGFSQPSQDSDAKQDLKNAGHETKDAAKDTGHAVKKGTEKGYHETKNGTKKVYHSTKHGTEKAWDKTKNTTKGAVDGGKEGAKEPDDSKRPQ